MSHRQLREEISQGEYVYALDAPLSWTQEHDDAPLHAPLPFAEVE